MASHSDLREADGEGGLKSTFEAAPRSVRRGIARLKSSARDSALFYPVGFFSILAQVSRNVTVRLKTMLPRDESLSAQKYPSRSN